jgi:hypothetical protein
MTWKRKDLLSMQDLEAGEIRDVLDTAESMKEIATREIKKVPTLRGKTVVNLFYEASTRTRTSFEIAGKWLSADVINFSASGSSAEKGESLLDTAKNIEAMSPDVVVVRHKASGAPAMLARNLRCAVVNAGDGAHEHPTQALLDLLTIREKKGHLEGLNVTIVGDVTHSRVARSDIHGMKKMGITVTVAGPPTLIPAALSRAGREGEPPAGGGHRPRRRDHDAAPPARAHDRGLHPLAPRVLARVGALSGPAQALPLGRAHHAPGPGEPGRGAVAGGRGRALLGDPGPGHQRRGGPHGGALPPRGEQGRMSNLLLRHGRVIDPWNAVDAVQDVLITDGKIARVGVGLKAPGGAAVVDAAGKVVCPGFIDIHVHLREPGFEYKETIATGTRSAAAGGFTAVACMANTFPVNDNRAVTDYILAKARVEGCVRVYPIGAVTRGLKGEELAEMGEQAEAGCVAFSDDGKCVMNAEVYRRAMEYALPFGVPIISHAEDCHLAHKGVMNEGLVSTELGLAGQPAAAEDVMVARDILLAELTGAHLHIAHISTAGAVRMVREARARGIRVTTEVTPHHLVMTGRGRARLRRQHQDGAAAAGQARRGGVPGRAGRRHHRLRGHGSRAPRLSPTRRASSRRPPTAWWGSRRRCPCCSIAWSVRAGSTCPPWSRASPRGRRGS